VRKDSLLKEAHNDSEKNPGKITSEIKTNMGTYSSKSNSMHSLALKQ